MQKIVLSKTYHGFNLTDEMIEYIGYKKKHKNDRGWEVSRTDSKLVEYLETTPKEKHNGLGVCYVPDDVKWVIEDYDSRDGFQKFTENGLRSEEGLVMNEVTAIKRDPYMDRNALAEHLRMIGQAIIDDAENIALRTSQVRRIEIRADVAPGEQLTYVEYHIERMADPRQPEK